MCDGKIAHIDTIFQILRRPFFFLFEIAKAKNGVFVRRSRWVNTELPRTYFQRCQSFDMTIRGLLCHPVCVIQGLLWVCADPGVSDKVRIGSKMSEWGIISIEVRCKTGCWFHFKKG